MRTEDGHLIQKCLNGDSSAFGYLVDKYRSGVYAHAYAKLRNFHDAEDVAQEVFIKAYEKLHTLKRWDNFSAWLYSITANLCKMWMRSRANRPDREYVEEQEEEILDAPSVDAYHDKQAHETLHEALAALPETYRQVLTLYYLGGMDSQEIAAFLGRPPGTVRQQLSRARNLLKEEMHTMMSATYDEMKLQPSFTFRIVELIKQTKIQPAPRTTALPWGVSITGGLIAIVLSLIVPYSPFYPIGALIGSALPSKTQVAERGVIPVDVVEVTKTPILSSDSGKKDLGQKPKPDPINAFAPPGQEGKWTQKADMPTARYAFSTSVVKGKIYAIGGWTVEGEPALSTVEEYDPITDIWTQKADMPTPRAYISTSVVNGKIYAIGGADNSGPLGSVEVYDPVVDTWTKKADMPPSDERQFIVSTAMVNGKIYTFEEMSEVEEYDPMTDKWMRKSRIPFPRGDFSTPVVNGKIYVIGGNINGGAVSIVEVYDPAMDTWARKANMPTARFLFSASVVNGKIYAIGGVDGGRGPLSSVEVYDPATDVWTKEAGMSTAKWQFATSVVNGKIYVIGGRIIGRSGLSAVEEYALGLR